MGLSSGSRSGLRGDLAHSSHFASAEAEAGRSRNRPRGTRPASTLGGFPFSTVALLLLTRSDPGGEVSGGGVNVTAAIFRRENPLSGALLLASLKNPCDPMRQRRRLSAGGRLPGPGAGRTPLPCLHSGAQADSGPSSSCLKGFSGLPAYSLLYLWKPLKTSKEGLIQCEVLSLKKFV